MIDFKINLENNFVSLIQTKEEHFEEWNIYPTHVIMEDDYWEM